MPLLKHRVPHWIWELRCRRRHVPAGPIQSVVIPCVGSAYTEEATLAATFAAQSQPDAREILIVTDQEANQFPTPNPKIKIKTLNLQPAEGRKFAQIWQSRLVKIQAPLLAQHQMVLLIDSDMNLLRQLQVAVEPGVLLGSFRKGRLAARVKNYPDLPELKGSWTPRRKFHLNGAFLLGDRSTWEQLSPLWLQLFESIWDKIREGQPPTDQLPLAIALDHLGFRTIDLGFWANWSVAKNIGDRPCPIPQQVIGAHGGFPLSEWNKYLEDPAAPLHFYGESYTRMERYKG